MMSIRRLVISALVAFLALGGCIPGRAEEPVTLAELKRQAPDRLQMTVTNDAGEIIEVDAPILLPEGETLPLVLVRRATFNTLDLFDVYPLPTGRDRYFYGASDHSRREVCDSLSIYQEEKENKIYGKTDYTHRYALPAGSMPPENDTTVEEIMVFIYENIERFHCDASLDIRVEEAVAMSGLCEMKRVKATDGNGVSWTEFAANPDKPTKKGTTGIWSLKLAQYMHGAQIMETYQPYGSYQPPNNPNYWYNPLHLFADWLDEQNRNIGIMAVKEIAILDEDTGLLSYDNLVTCLENRIKAGKLKSIYTLRLGYSVRIVKGDAYWTDERMSDFCMDTRFALVPEWQILGFDEKDAATAKSVGYEQPSKEAILDPANHSRYGIRYEVRMDASTGEFILDYESQEFNLAK